MAFLAFFSTFLKFTPQDMLQSRIWPLTPWGLGGGFVGFNGVPGPYLYAYALYFDFEFLEKLAYRNQEIYTNPKLKFWRLTRKIALVHDESKISADNR